MSLITRSFLIYFAAWASGFAGGISEQRKIDTAWILSLILSIVGGVLIPNKHDIIDAMFKICDEADARDNK